MEKYAIVSGGLEHMHLSGVPLIEASNSFLCIGDDGSRVDAISRNLDRPQG
jgi:hypothetical protein